MREHTAKPHARQQGIARACVSPCTAATGRLLVLQTAHLRRTVALLPA
jgi:hypothetical protein